MNTTPDAKGKVERPATYFEAPGAVVSDPLLSAEEKREALDTLEQDARQLAEATAEGMAGGEPANLEEVLRAKADLGEKAELGEADDRASRPTWGAELAQTVRARPFWSIGLAAVAGISIGAYLRR